MTSQDIILIDSVPADSLEIGDQVIIDGDEVEIRGIESTNDPDEIVIRGYSYSSGDMEEYSLYADDYYDLWSV